MNELVRILSERIFQFSYSPAMTEILEAIIRGEWSTIRMQQILEANKIRSNSVALKQEALDVAIKYAQICLEDDVLTDDEINSMSLLKRMLNIEEGDFYKYGKKEDVEAIIARQLNRLYEDNKISSDEALYKVQLQGLFNLSYQQFEAIVHDIAKAAQERGADYAHLDTYSIKYKESEPEPEETPFTYRDALFEECARYVVQNQEAMVSRLQRHFELGYMRAAHIADQLEEAGIISALEYDSHAGCKMRKVLIKDMDELNALLEKIG